MSNDLALLTSALAGAVGALLLRSLLKLAGKAWAARFPIAVYDCVTDGEGPGLYRHGWGEEVNDERTRSKKAWSYTLKQIPRRGGKLHEHTLFGPYVNDFGRPGYFEVRFRIAGEGLGGSDRPIVVLDVIQAPFDLQRNHLVVGQRIVRCRDISKAYRPFKVRCYAVGSGVYEYRASVSFDQFKSQQDQGAKPKVIFNDKVEVHRRVPLWEVL